MAHIITISQGKGGASKTTTSVNLAGALLEKGYATILIDWDVEKPDAWKQWSNKGEDLKWVKLIDTKDPINHIETLKNKYDFIIFDTPPNYDKNAFKAIMASDFVIIPTSANYLESENTHDSITVPMLANKPFKVLMSRVKKGTKKGREIFQDIKNQTVSFETIITEREQIALCPGYKQWIGDFAKGSESHKQYQKLANEVLSWVNECHARDVEKNKELI